ncbi:acyl-CoA N-acyltransferase [Sphaerosporella brunnea]|uniref:Histone acetyltransferase type B catalytic subunit n=1 Tax=Sphaerosporella brunnea TaxID=1250544 RepID=A0A5J5EZA5_9PEZI|nr:acyl-CoA N-acyltransferase [Sphaerosporella brunnea]
MASAAEAWSVDANEAVTLSFYSPKTGEETATGIPPTFTYPLYGDAQAIYGYKDLVVHLKFAQDSMEPAVEATWAEKAPQIGDVEAEDVLRPLEEHLPYSAFSGDHDGYVKYLQRREVPFRPPGVLQTTFDHNGRRFEVWRSNINDTNCAQLLANMQILVLLYIEGGSPIDLNDEVWSNQRWEVFFLYEKMLDDTYAFIGYCTLYRWYFFDKAIPNQTRVRLSQFLILPQYQREGHGSRFYDAIIQYYLDSPKVREITVEDPSEEFADLRDRRDMLRLGKDPDFLNVKLADVVSKKFPIKEMRACAKMPERQFLRCLEMQLFQGLNVKDKKQYKQYRLIVKGRIYKQHSDLLAQLDRLERIDKLDETYRHVEDDYQRLLLLMKKSSVQEAGEVDKSGKAPKRIAQESVATAASSRPTKKVRVQDAEDL